MRLARRSSGARAQPSLQQQTTLATQWGRRGRPTGWVPRTMMMRTLGPPGEAQRIEDWQSHAARKWQAQPLQQYPSNTQAQP